MVAASGGREAIEGSGRGRTGFSPARPRISVIVPVYNGGVNFRRCLASLAAAVPPPDELIVVADGDTDGSWIVATQFGARVFRLPTRSGPARARNRGAREARGDILLFVDADVTVPTDALSQVATAFAREPSLAAVFGSYDDAPAATNFLSQYKNLLHHYVHQTAREDASTFWGACGAVRREVFLELGGFDERYRKPSVEDIELGYRLIQAGQKIRLCKTLQVKHLKHWRAGSLFKADFFYRALPWTELILRHRHLPNDLNLRPSGRASVLLTHGLLGSVLGAGWWPGALTVAGGLMLTLLALNAPLYRFFLGKRGLRFVAQAIPWHWLYYGYSGVAFVLGTASFLARGRRPARTGLTVVAEGRPDAQRRPEWR
ncbi:MAG: glycosyltransferase [Deltaproteobacteria bacterium]|nr:glycosyltransferase [Deltaproteobacteria bacterium]